MNKPEEEFTIKLHPRPQEKVSLDIPTDTLASLKKVAASRDMSCEALLKLYIGQGLREDLAKSFSNRVLEATAQVLAKHIDSEAEISDILQEIRTETSR
ncbi:MULTISPECIES: hypothetical protein [Moorena]|uniref:Ribbon-helix-helix protein CopG domain-containing protein n=2 Tax=Moorena TaxID=1155738 RepID=F4XXU6_9CYAN|nr:MULTISPECIES: hypothetical protein [Moorena]NEP32634.1 hypothetical protein [Moorena sp. SIO3B2]NEQ17702.1 hypothetical protein [Moorena sp. SIO3E2]EGJ30599.1 hypothetical protein LYNGBM3L_48890 [Moorena producens 3L]NEP68298.1 hypothetical protein [Moorena sp. SIO3A5]NES39929.1 hypothetical protein [Moorena sp. SIO2C4]